MELQSEIMPKQLRHSRATSNSKMRGILRGVLPDQKWGFTPELRHLCRQLYRIVYYHCVLSFRL